MTDITVGAAMTSLIRAGACIRADDDGIAVSFEECGATSLETLELLIHIPNLTSLCFYDTPVDGSLLQRLTSHDTLRSLNLNGTSVVAADCVLVSRFPHLQTIGLMDTLADDSCIDSLLTCRELWNLRIDGTHVSPAGLERLVAGLPLTSLWIGGRQVTIDSMTAVERHLNLNEFNICGKEVRDDLIPAFEPLRTQRTILNFTAFTSSGRATMRRRYPHILVNS
jgi:hypothetical protein